MKELKKISAMFMLAVMFTIPACGSGSETPANPSHDLKDQTAFWVSDGNIYTCTMPGGTKFKAILTPDILRTNRFPIYMDDSSSRLVPAHFIVGETEVTYELWYEVYKWATSDAGGVKRADGGVLYYFANAGREGNDGIIGDAPTTAKQEPVTTVTWRDTVVWCNALTEYYNANNGSETDFECAYTYNTEIIRDSRDVNAAVCDAAIQGVTAKGFRLMTSYEWEFSARYIGTDIPSHMNYVVMDGIYYSKGNSASGAISDYTDASATAAVAVYRSSSTNAVKSKSPNYLGLYDMSGNVFELCYDSVSHNRVSRGGSFLDNANYMSVGDASDPHPYYSSSYLGFRLCKSR